MFLQLCRLLLFNHLLIISLLVVCCCFVICCLSLVLSLAAYCSIAYCFLTSPLSTSSHPVLSLVVFPTPCFTACYFLVPHFTTCCLLFHYWLFQCLLHASLLLVISTFIFATSLPLFLGTNYSPPLPLVVRCLLLRCLLCCLNYS